MFYREFIQNHVNGQKELQTVPVTEKRGKTNKDDDDDDDSDTVHFLK